MKDRETGARRDSRTVHFWEFLSAPNEKHRTEEFRPMANERIMKIVSARP